MERILSIGLLITLMAHSCYGKMGLNEVYMVLSGKIDMVTKELTMLRDEVMETKKSLGMTQEALGLMEEKVSEVQTGSKSQVSTKGRSIDPLEGERTSECCRNLLQAFQDEKTLLRDTEETVKRKFSVIYKELRQNDNMLNQTHQDVNGLARSVEELQQITALLAKDSQRRENRLDKLSMQTDKLNMTQMSLGDLVQGIQEMPIMKRLTGRHRSCLDIYTADKTSRSGVYVIHSIRNESLEVFCQFDCNSGYMFLSSNSMRTLQSADLPSGSFDHVVLRHQKNDGSQFESRMEQISRYRHLPLSVQVNQFIGYGGIQNKNMGPYLYLGFTPKSKVSRGDIEGYRVFGHDIKFSNCDGNPNSYFVFLFNHKNAKFTSYRHPATPISREWINKSKPVAPSAYLPCGFFASFEIHFGGCGAYATSHLMGDVSGATLGFPFSYK